MNFSPLQGGFHLFNIMDTQVGGYPLLMVGIFELIAISWVYGEFRTNSMGVRRGVYVGSDEFGSDFADTQSSVTKL